MLKKQMNLLKVIVKQLAIAFFITAFLITIVYVMFHKKIELGFSLINKITIVEKEGDNTTEYDEDNQQLIKYPNYGTIFATIQIPKIDVEVNVYHGDSLELLKYGAGHSAATYFPGEGGTVLVAAHNSKKYFGLIPQLVVGDEIIFDTNYGTFNYEITKTAIVKATELAKMEIQDDHEELILYTCYPVNRIGLKTQRFVVYAKLVGATYED